MSYSVQNNAMKEQIGKLTREMNKTGLSKKDTRIFEEDLLLLFLGEIPENKK